MLITKRVAIGSDHAGYNTKEAVKERLKSLGLSVLDCGTDSENSVDYPDFANEVARAILSGKADMGVLLCGSGIGISIAANRHKGIRAALCHSAETAELSRRHNDANILVLGARVLKPTIIEECVDTFFRTPFEGGRHQARVEKLG